MNILNKISVLVAQGCKCRGYTLTLLNALTLGTVVVDYIGDSVTSAESIKVLAPNRSKAIIWNDAKLFKKAMAWNEGTSGKVITLI